MSVETTEREIIDVVLDSATDPKLAKCVVEEIWSTRLPSASWPARETHVVQFD